ncbi:MAG: hypothetical protein ACI4KB_09110 [Oscillospiraceae bacterium]|nr:hypothetical protein [Oscillospiraceae bacterium]
MSKIIVIGLSVLAVAFMIGFDLFISGKLEKNPEKDESGADKKEKTQEPVHNKTGSRT